MKKYIKPEFIENTSLDVIVMSDAFDQSDAFDNESPNYSDWYIKL